MPVVPCTTVQPVLGIVNFDATEFLVLYPEFTGINSMQPTALANDFVGATFLLNNSCCSRVQDANQRMLLLYLLTAHIAAIHQGLNDAGVGNPTFSGTVAIAGNTATVSAVASGALAVGNVLYDGPSIGGSLIVPGTTITVGSGGLGAYTVNGPTQTVLAEKMIVMGIPLVIPPLGVVGRISDASEGDVSVSAQWEAPPNANQAYFTQTKYGADYWTYTAKYRTAIFMPAPASAYSPLAGLGLGPWGGNGFGQ